MNVPDLRHDFWGPAMKPVTLAALIVAAYAGTACAQTPPSPSRGPIAQPPPSMPAAGPSLAPPDAAPAFPPGTVPPLPPGCVTAAPPPATPPIPALYSEPMLANALGISVQQAARVRAVFREQSEQAQNIEQQRRDLDASTCRKLHAIVGDAGFARWVSVAPPPPRPRGPGGPPPRP